MRAKLMMNARCTGQNHPLGEGGMVVARSDPPWSLLRE
jgi:hypothetical protein